MIKKGSNLFCLLSCLHYLVVTIWTNQVDHSIWTGKNTCGFSPSINKWLWGPYLKLPVARWK